jgi:S-ribosylhomocysteine lyase LuxS involved in autoinducer biosynthesis
MQGPTKDDEASIPKRAKLKRPQPWTLTARDIKGVTPLTPPQYEYIPATKKPRREEYLTRTAAKAARETASPDVAVSLPPTSTLRRSTRVIKTSNSGTPAPPPNYADDDFGDANDDDDGDANDAPVMDTQPTSSEPRRNWKPEEDTKLTKAVKKYGKNWVTVAAMVPGRKNRQCHSRWVQTLDPANMKKGPWTPEEDATLMEAMKKHGKEWAAIAAMVPGRTNQQCRHRWTQALDPANWKGKWTPEQDAKLTAAVKTHGKDWVANSKLVPGRTNNQCHNRWTHTLDPANVKTGKWTPKEDAKLTEAVKKLGKDCWAAVAPMVPGRRSDQCRSRWTHTLDPAKVKNPGKWKPEEDAKLNQAVEKHIRDWVAVAALVPGRTRAQCWKRWVLTFDPANGKKGKWTPEEDTKLTEAVKKLGKDCWAAVAPMVPGRRSDQCRTRWVQTLDPTIEKKPGKWTPEEDTKLTKAVKKHGNHWIAVTAMVPDRTDRQCRRRWVDTLDPAKEKGKWKAEEDAKLTKAVQKHGKDWVAAAAMVRGRTSLQCRQRWTHTLDPASEKGKWTPEEDAKLTIAVKKHGKNWATVAAMVPGRTNNQCRHRWVFALDPANAKGKWTPKEDAKLTAVVKKHGKKWAEIAVMLPGRTNRQCRKHWVQTLDPDRASNTVEEE